MVWDIAGGIILAILLLNFGLMLLGLLCGGIGIAVEAVRGLFAGNKPS